MIKKTLSAKFGVILLVAMALALPASAVAEGGPTCQAYNPQLCSVVGKGQTKPGGAVPNGTVASGTAASTLPFTGLDLGLLAVGAGVLLGGGMFVRRLSRPSA